MDDQTITEEAVVDTGAEQALPEATEESTAVADTQDQSATSDVSEGEQSSLPEVDEKLKSFAKGQGIEDFSELSERERKLLKVAYDNNAEFQRTRQKASQLEKTLDQGITEEAEVQGITDEDRLDIVRLKTRMTVRDFFDANPDAKNHEVEMAKLVAERPHLAGDLDALYALALRNSGNDQSLKSEGAKEALQSLAGKQRAAAPTGAAVSSAAAPNKITRELIAQKTQAGDIAWLSQNQAAINQAVADGTLI